MSNEKGKTKFPGKDEFIKKICSSLESKDLAENGMNLSAEQYEAILSSEENLTFNVYYENQKEDKNQISAVLNFRGNGYSIKYANLSPKKVFDAIWRIATNQAIISNIIFTFLHVVLEVSQLATTKLSLLQVKVIEKLLNEDSPGASHFDSYAESDVINTLSDGSPESRKQVADAIMELRNMKVISKFDDILVMRETSPYQFK